MASGVLLSALFNVAVIALIVFWAMGVPGGLKVAPPELLWFAGWIFLHTMVYYGVFNPGAFTWSPQVVDLGVKLSMREPTLFHLFKLFLYLLYGVALGGLLVRPDQWTTVLTGLLLGNLGVMLVNNPLAAFLAGERYLGGYSNPNAYAEVAFVLIATGLFVAMLGRGSSRLVAVVSVAVGVFGLVLSQSRGALLVVLLAMVFWYQARGRVRVGPLILGALGLAVVGVLVVRVVGLRTEGLLHNVRLLIWASYLEALPRYVLTGVGFGREMSVISTGIFYDRIWNPHNTYLGLMVGVGVLGPVLLIRLVWKVGSSLKRLGWDNPALRESRWVIAAFVLAYGVLLFFGDRIQSRATWQLFGTAFAALRLTADRRSDSFGEDTGT